MTGNQQTVLEEQTGESALYQQLGGAAAVDAAVDLFYRKVLGDGRINSFFDGVDMDRQIAGQKAFLTMAFGGPHNYKGADLRRGHRHLVARGLNDSDFWRNSASRFPTFAKRGPSSPAW